jgi:hypothetical protein
VLRCAGSEFELARVANSLWARTTSAHSPVATRALELNAAVSVLGALNAFFLVTDTRLQRVEEAGTRRQAGSRSSSGLAGEVSDAALSTQPAAIAETQWAAEI